MDPVQSSQIADGDEDDFQSGYLLMAGSECSAIHPLHCGLMVMNLTIFSAISSNLP